MPKVSVVIPVYNVENYLPRCIDSVLKQTYSDFELILVDDGSPDNSGEICDAYAKKDSRVRVIHKKNAGVSAARNTGIEASQGDYIMFVDSDDYIDASMLEAMLVYDGRDMILSGLRYVEEDDNFLKQYLLEKMDKVLLYEFVEKYYGTDACNYILGGPYNKLIHKRIFHKYGVHFDETLSICEDGLFVVECLAKCETVSNVDAAFYNYVQYGSGTLMSRYNANAIEACALYHNAKIALLDKNSADASVYAEVEKASAQHMAGFFFQIYTRSGLSGKEKYRKAKEAFVNPIFKTLARQTKKKSFKALLIKTTAIIGWVWPLHVICSLVFRGK